MEYLKAFKKKMTLRTWKSGWDNSHSPFLDSVVKTSSRDIKKYLGMLRNDALFAGFSFRLDMFSRYFFIYWIVILCAALTLKNGFLIFSFIILSELLFFLISLYTGQRRYKDRAAVLVVLIGFALDEVFCDFGFLENIKYGAPRLIVEFAVWFNSWITFWYGVITYFLFFFVAACLPLLCVFWSIVLPLVSAAVAGLLGFTIGAVYIGYVCSALILLTFVSVAYLMFVFPAVRVLFKQYESRPFNSLDEALSAWHTQDYMGERYDAFKELSINPEYLSLDVKIGEFVNNSFLFGEYNFFFDSISLFFALVVTFISFLVHVYSIEYMRNDPHIVRFYCFLSLFTFFMMLLVGSANLILLFIGWEGVGVCSFLLISFWYTRVAAVKAGIKAMVINKIGDMFLLLGIAITVIFSYGSTDIRVANLVAGPEAEQVHFLLGYSFLDLMAVCFCVAAAVKSAQFGFHTWLPDAMEGPTPVSALLHAATMVTAGLFLILKFSFVISASYAAKGLLIVLGVTTLFFGASVACFQFDIKKIIAYSTGSQLGLMFLAVGISASNLAIFHFFNHAFFKCLLFLLAGVIIHELKNEQDIRKMGGLVNKVPFVFTCFVIASLSLAGFPTFSGSVSKDLIFSVTDYLAFQQDGTWGATIFFLALRLSSVLTIIYSSRLIFYVFFGDYRFRRGLLPKGYYDVALRKKAYLWPITVLTLLSITSGKLFKKCFIHSEGLYIGVENDLFVCDLVQEAIISYKFTFLSWIISLGGVWIAVSTMKALLTSYRGGLCYYIAEEFYYYHVMRRADRWYRLYCYFNRKGYIDDFYAHFLVRPVILLSFVLRKDFERGIFKAPLMALSRTSSALRFAVTPLIPKSEFLWLTVFPFGAVVLCFVICAAIGV